MKARRVFPSLRRVMVPIIDGCDPEDALAAAATFASDTVLVGVVRVPEGEALSAAAAAARRVRASLRRLGQEPRVRTKARVRVSTQPWLELRAAAEGERPDLLLIDWNCALVGLGVTPAELLSGSPSNLALVRGRVPPAPLRVLLPMRGGPYAELALRLALSLGPAEIVPLHLTRPGDAATDAPFRGLERVLRHLPELHARYATTDDPAATILALEIEGGACAGPGGNEIITEIVRVDVTETESTVDIVVWVRETPFVGTCAGVGMLLPVEAALTTPLGDRTLWDGGTVPPTEVAR